MTILISIIAVLLVWAVFKGLEYYLTRSLRSFRKAETHWPKLVAQSQELLAMQISAGFASVVFQLMATAGCGCYVRGMLLSHYLPVAWLADDSDKSRDVDVAFRDIERAPAEQREAFAKLVAQVVVYDSFRNPLQGWLLRRVMKQVLRPEPSVKVRYESQITVRSVLARRSSHIEKPELAVA